MPDERMARTVCTISDVFENIISRPHWFISFGTLLWFVRDRLLGRPFEQDIDISLLYGQVGRDDLIEKFGEYGYVLDNELLDNHKRQPLQMTFKPQAPGLWPADIDLFFWVLGANGAWHSYDVCNLRQPIQSDYQFKLTPKNLITAPTVSMVWEEIAPTLKFPSMYGSLLDIWYPPITSLDGTYQPNSCWLFQNRQYGQSKCEVVKSLKSCENMAGVLG